MARPWHSGQMYKTRRSKQVLNNFSLGKVSSFPSSSVCSPELPFQTAAGSVPVLSGCSWEQFITSKSQLSTLEPSELFPPSHIIFENIIGGEERTSTLIAVIVAPGEGQRVFHFYSILFYYLIPIIFLLFYSIKSYSILHLFLHSSR